MNLIELEKDLIAKHERYMIQTPGFSPLVVDEAKGSIIKDVTGKEYIDFGSMNAGHTGIGASNPRVVKAIKDQVEKLITGPCTTPNIPKIRFAEKLAKITPPKLNKFHFLTGGGESVDYAVHTAMKIQKKQEIISLYYAYHGATMGTLALGQPWNRREMTITPGFRQIPNAYCYRCFYGKERQQRFVQGY